MIKKFLAGKGKYATAFFYIAGIAMLFCFLCSFPAPAFAQTNGNITVTGTIKDSTGKPLQGVTVMPSGARVAGTATDANGRFILDVKPGTVITVSYIGYQEQQFTVTADRKVLNIVMKIMVSTGEEVIVTAYGRKQRREAVVGSVTSVTPAALKIPSSNLTTALAGQIAGMIAFQRGGQPGMDNAQFFIRGVTTFGYSANPLILVDNIELSGDDLARLQVDDIASFSILKDASAAALYGARGANGVILITTKEGLAGKARVNVRFETAISKPTQTVELADPVTYMKMYNEATTTRKPLAGPFFTPNDILNTQATMNNEPGSNKYVYPAVDWMSTLFKRQTTTRRLNFNVQGGSNAMRYYIAGSYDRDNGILQVNPVNNFNSGMKFENYQLRSNVNIKITPSTEAILRLWGNFNDYTGPITGDQSGFATDLYDRALHTSPIAFPAYYLPDSAHLLDKHILFGNSTLNGSRMDNPYADLMSGYKNFSQSRMSAQFELNQDLGFITPGLKFHGLFSTNRYAYFDLKRAYKPFYYHYSEYNEATNQYKLQWLNNGVNEAQEFLSYYGGDNIIDTYIYLLGSLEYAHNFGEHNISASLVGTRSQTLKANAGSLQLSLPYRNLGLAGRISYSYQGKYFIESNFGYNGSERFSTQHRYGFFPTVGAGWVISNEDFYKNSALNNIVTRLKIRASYGLVGNDNIGDQRFFYLSGVTPDGGGAAYFGTTNGFSMKGTSIQNYPNPDVTWETSQKSNLALELSLWQHLNITAEVYHEYRYNILQTRGYIPVTSGLEAQVSANVGKASSTGLDLHVDYKQNLSKDAWAAVLGNLTVTSSKVIHYEEPEYKYPWRFQTGQPINQPFGYIAERLFVDDKETNNSPTQLFGGGLPMGGDIKYRDVNKDGVINQDDQVPIGLPTTPQINYGFGFSAGYKNFDLNAFFQGLARESFFINPTSTDDRYHGIYGTAPFANNAQLLKAYADSHWSEENQNLYALWPRLSTYSIANNEQQSTWWLRDGSFLRLKSVEVGYTLPQRWAKTMYLSNMRIYFNGLNLVTWSHFRLWDPEQGGNGFGYPIQKVINFGINLNF